MKNKFILVAVLAAIVYGWNYWGTSIYILDEAKNAGCAAEMMQRGDWITPTFNNEFHDKPALQYFFMMTAYSVFGVNAFSARFFSVIFGILTVLCVFWFTRRVLNEKVAFYAALLLISSLQMAYQFRMAVPDPYLLFFLTTGLFAFYVGYIEDRKGFLYLFYAFIGLAFVAKGPIAIALPGLIVLIFLLWRKDFSWGKLMKLQLFPGALVTLIVALPWYVAVGVATDWAWPKYFFITHNYDRYVTTFEGHGGFPGDTVAIVIGALMPVSFFFPQMLKMVWGERKNQPLLLFSLVVCITLIGFFLFSKTVLPSYPAPCIPFAAVLLAYFVDRVETEKSTKAKRLSINGIVFLFIAIAIPIIVFVAMGIDPELKDLTYLAYYFLAIPIGAIVALVYLFRRDMQKAFYSYVISFMITLILVFTYALPAADAKNPASRSMAMINEYNRPVAYFQWINSAYVFQYGKPIPKLNNEEELSDFIKKNGKVLIISSKKDWANSHRDDFKTVFECKDLFENPTSVVVVN